MPRPNAQIWAFLHRRSCSTDLWIGQLFLEHSTFLPTSHHRPHVRRQIQQTAIWIARFVCVNHLPEPSLSSELNFHVSESAWWVLMLVFACICARWCAYDDVCIWKNLQSSHSHLQNYQKITVQLLIERKRQLYLWICQRRYLNFLIRGVGKIHALVGDYMQPWNISGF